MAHPPELSDQYTDLLNAIRLMTANHEPAAVLDFILHTGSTLMGVKEASLILLDEKSG